MCKNAFSIFSIFTLLEKNITSKFEIENTTEGQLKASNTSDAC